MTIQSTDTAQDDSLDKTHLDSSNDDDDGDDAESINRGAIKFRKIPSDKAMFLHIGKAGGGTVVERNQLWKVNVQECHPKPCHKSLHKFPGFFKHHEQRRYIVAIRDPVDRFVSAFYWRKYILCNPKAGDKRKHSNEAHRNPEKFCKVAHKEEFHFIHDVFQGDANILAEALCTSSLPNATTASKSDVAVNAIKRLQHAMYSLTDWLDFEWQSENMFAVVTEKQAVDLVSQVDASMEWLFNHSVISETASKFKQRARLVSQQQIKGNAEHSSKDVKKEISPKGVQCLAEYYRKDYVLLKDQKEKLCKTSECLTGIDSILKRRSFLLEN